MLEEVMQQQTQLLYIKLTLYLSPKSALPFLSSQLQCLPLT